MGRLATNSGSLRKDETSTILKNSYLLGYNVLQTALWTLGVGLTLWTLIRTGSGAGVYAAAAPVVKFAQLLALIETLHAATGLVRGSPLMSFLQWFGRSNVLFLIADYIPEVQGHWYVASTFVAWGLADMIRYPFYACALVGKPQPWLTWLRYTAFIVLYPWGMFLGEWPLVYNSLPYIKERQLHSISMPNAWNFAFSYYIFCVVSLAVIMPGALLQLYLYLLAQRRRYYRRKPPAEAAADEGVI
eukprot:jgi/Botrbrau1/11018/Bobra.101_1s0016.1